MNQFQLEGLLGGSSMASILSVKFLVSELAEFCKSNGFHSKDKKNELVTQLAANVEASVL